MTSFPKEDQRRKKWLEFCGITNQRKKIYEKHFSDIDIDKPARNASLGKCRLMGNAIPKFNGVAEMVSTLRPNIEYLQWLLGKWESIEVTGQYPTVKDFSFREIIEFASIGQPLINYSSIAKNYETNAPMHLERGFLKIKPGTNQVALVASQNSGISSVEEGSVEGKVLHLETTSIGRISFAKKPFVTKFQRKYWLEDDVLNYEQHMETESTPLQKHLFVKYRRMQ